MKDLVLDASAAVEICLRSDLGASVEKIAPMGTTWWVPDGIFDVDVEGNATLRQLELIGGMTGAQTVTARLRLANLRLRRRRVAFVADRAWSLRLNITSPDACYVALAELLGCALLTTDMKLVNAPTLPVPTIHPSAMVGRTIRPSHDPDDDMLRLAVRDLWISGWAPTALADEIRRRTNSIDARDLIVHALVEEDAERSEQAKTEEWTQAVTFLAAASGVESVEIGWVMRWIVERADRDAAQEVLFDVLDALQDMRLSVA